MTSTMPRVVSVSLQAQHTFSKQAVASIDLVAGRGVRGDAHFGETVKHRSRVARDPTQPNLRQVHLIQSELFTELQIKGFTVAAAALGENVTTVGVDLLSLPRGTRLVLGHQAEIELTGLRNPCPQIDAFQEGLMQAVLDRDAKGNLIRKAGVMAIVVYGGVVSVGDPIHVQLPAEPHQVLEKV